MYRVEIARPSTGFGPPWWQVHNLGSPAQASAALSELAARIEPDLRRPGTPACKCWYRYQVRWPDGALLDSAQGFIEAASVPTALRSLARTVLSATHLIRDNHQ